MHFYDFYHATAHLWQAAEAYQNVNPARTPQMWFERLRHQLRHGYVHRILSELRGQKRCSASMTFRVEITSIAQEESRDQDVYKVSRKFSSTDCFSCIFQSQMSRLL